MPLDLLYYARRALELAQSGPLFLQVLALLSRLPHALQVVNKDPLGVVMARMLVLSQNLHLGKSLGKVYSDETSSYFTISGLFASFLSLATCLRKSLISDFSSWTS